MITDIEFKNNIEEEISKLPEIKREVISSFDWIQIVEQAGKIFNLDQEKTLLLKIETGLVLLGDSYLEAYEAYIEENLELSTDLAKKINKYITDNIFSVIVNKIDEKLKTSGISRSASWKQTIGFIISGGDYSKFLN